MIPGQAYRAEQFQSRTCDKLSDGSRLRPTIGPVEQLDRVQDGDLRARRDLRDAADIAGRDEVRLRRLDVLDLAAFSLPEISGCRIL